MIKKEYTLFLWLQNKKSLMSMTKDEEKFDLYDIITLK